MDSFAAAARCCGVPSLCCCGLAAAGGFFGGFLGGAREPLERLETRWRLQLDSARLDSSLHTHLDQPCMCQQRWTLVGLGTSAPGPCMRHRTGASAEA